jgi:hypothetical protein
MEMHMRLPFRRTVRRRKPVVAAALAAALAIGGIAIQRLNRQV